MGVLYGTNASRESHDRDYDPKGLGAISPLRRPAVITSGGGYAPQGGGAGGGAGAGETSVQGSRVRSGYAPADRTTSIRFFAAKGKARGAFSKSGRGSKESPMSPGSWATPAGLSGLDFGWGNLKPPKIVRKAAIAAVFPIYAGTYHLARAVERNVRVWSRPRRREAQPAPGVPTSYGGPGPGYYPLGTSQLSGLDGGVFGWLKDRFTPPGGDITRIQIVPPKIREFIPSPIRTAVRYAGAVPFTATVGLFTPAPVARKIFGLSPAESKVQEMGAKAARVTAALVATAGAATWATGAGPLVNAPVASGYAPGLSPLSLGTTAAKPVFAANTTGYATPAMFGGTGTVFSGGTYAPASASLYAASSAVNPVAMGAGGLPLSGTNSLIVTKAPLFVPPPPPPPASAGWGAKLLSGTGEVAKAVGIQVGAQAVLSTLAKTPGAEAAQSYYGGEFGASPTAPLPAFVMPTEGGYASGGGGESSGYGDAVASSGFSPLIGLGLAGLGLALYLKNRKTWRTA